MERQSVIENAMRQHVALSPMALAVRVVRGAADITDFLDIPAAVGGIIDLNAATVKAEYVKETLDARKARRSISRRRLRPRLRPRRRGRGLFIA